jgi:hypothetical protein
MCSNNTLLVSFDFLVFLFFLKCTKPRGNHSEYLNKYTELHSLYFDTNDDSLNMVKVKTNDLETVILMTETEHVFETTDLNSTVTDLTQRN